MFTLTWKWSTFLGFVNQLLNVNQLLKRTTVVQPTNDYTDAQMTQGPT